MTYKYRCEKGHEFELEQKISEKPCNRCQECGCYAGRVPFVGEDANGNFKINGYSEKNGYSG